VVIAGYPRGQEPPDTTGAGDDCAGADEGACGGCERPPALLEPDPLEPELAAVEPALGDGAGWLTAPAELDVVCPFEARAATSEIAPANATAPAIVQRLIFAISARPELRVLTAREAISRLR
jgi:hypothetical protein